MSAPLTDEQVWAIRESAGETDPVDAIETLMADRRLLLAALGRCLEETCWCALCDGHHHEGDGDCPVRVPV